MRIELCPLFIAPASIASVHTTLTNPAAGIPGQLMRLYEAIQLL
jgi:hypothetical protein